MKKNASRIVIDVTLDTEKVPSEIQWQATDQSGPNHSEAKAMLLSLFDKESKDTLKIDLWTKEMQVAEMDRFFYHTLKSLADTYFRSTGNKALAGAMQQFATYFGQESEIIPKDEEPA